MLRLAWLPIVCVVVVVGLVAVRNFGGISRTLPEAVAANVTEVTTAPSVKGDRLSSRFFDETLPSTVAVQTQKVTPTERRKEPDAKDDIVSWHWHEGSKSVQRRRAAGHEQ